MKFAQEKAAKQIKMKKFQMLVKKLISFMYTVPPPDMGNRVAIGRPRAYRDHDRENQPSVSTRFYVINSNRGYAVGAVQIRGRQTDILSAEMFQ